MLVPPPPAGTTGPDKPGDAEPAGDAGEKPIDPRLIPREQAPSTTPTLTLGEPRARAARAKPPALQRLRVARVSGTPAAMLWLRRGATVSVRVKTRAGKLVKRIGAKKVGAGAASVLLGRLPGGRYALVVTVKDGPRGATATTRNFRLAG